MKYKKPPLAYEQQASKLIERGLIANHQELVKYLKAVNYYRLSGYWYPFRNPDSTFKPNTTIDKIWHRYIFDRKFRLLVMDAIERIEVSIRTHLVYEFSHAYGSFGYLKRCNLPNLKEYTDTEGVKQNGYTKFIDRIQNETKHSKEVFVKHFFTTYDDSHNLPLWMAVEIMSFGMMLTMFRGVDDSFKKKIATKYDVSDTVLESWLKSLNVIRNICAHHGRLWNRELGYKPMIPKKKKNPEWHSPVSFANNRIFSILTICKYMMKKANIDVGWQENLENLLIESKDIPLRPMGFPDNWQELSIWK